MAGFTFKCPNCDAPLNWEGSLEKVHCEYCGSQFTIEEVERYNAGKIEKTEIRDAERASRERQNRDETERADDAGGGAGTAAAESGRGARPATAATGHLRSYQCASCGADVVTDETTMATFCYFCHNPVILTDRVGGDFRPDRIIPFRVNREEAEKIFLKWASSKRFVPRSFYSRPQLEKITGMYLPFWMADAEAEIHLEGKGEKSKTWQSGNVEYTETEIFGISRHGGMEIDHVAEIAYNKNNKIDPALILSVANYDESELRDFAMSYLSGYFSETWNLSKEEVLPLLETRIEQYVENLSRESIEEYDRVSLEQNEVTPRMKAVRYTLLPAWVMTYFYGGKTFVYAINGQTGEAFGELPIDKKRLGIWSLLIALLILAICLLGGQFIW